MMQLAIFLVLCKISNYKKAYINLKIACHKLHCFNWRHHQSIDGKRD